RKVVKRTTVDYRWELETNVHAKMPLRRCTSIVGDMTARILGVDASLNRGTQHGYRGEAGLLFEGKAGAIELYIAGEQRIDPYPLEFGTARWASLGFRFLSRARHAFMKPRRRSRQIPHPTKRFCTPKCH